MTVYSVQTTYGRQEIEARALIEEWGILILLKGVPANDNLRPGAIYVRSADLARRTRGRHTHLVVKDGVYDLWRLFWHQHDSSFGERETLFEVRRDLLAGAASLQCMDHFSRKELKVLAERYQTQADDFSMGVRDAQKLEAAGNLAHAGVLLASANRNGASVSAHVSQAADALQERVHELESIGYRAGAKASRVYGVIQDLGERLTCLVGLIDRGLATPSLRCLEAGIWPRPQHDLAMALAEGLRAANRVRAVELLCQMRLIHQLELEVVSGLAFLLHQAKAFRRAPDEDFMPRVRESFTRFQKTWELVSERLSPATRAQGNPTLASVETALRDGQWTQAKSRLKQLSLGLAEVPPPRVP